MNRRRFLSFLGLAPLIAAPAIFAAAKAAPKSLNTGGIVTGEVGPEIVDLPRGYGILSSSMRRLVQREIKIEINKQSRIGGLLDR